MSAKPKTLQALAAPGVASAADGGLHAALQTAFLSDTGQHNASGSIDLQINALATVLEVARGEVSAKQIARLAELEARLEDARRALENAAAIDQSAAHELKRAEILLVIAAWKGRKGPAGRHTSALAIAERLVADVPIAARPWMHQVRDANRSFCASLESMLSKRDRRLSEMFPIAEGAQGGALKGRGPLNEQEKAAAKRKRLDDQRYYRARVRARGADL